MPKDVTDLDDLQPTVTIPAGTIPTGTVSAGTVPTGTVSALMHRSLVHRSADGWWLYPVRAQPHHTDYAGIVWHGSYVTWLEEARVECLRHVGVEFADCVALGCDLPVVDMALKYHQSVRLGMAVVVRLRMVKKGVRLIFDYEVRAMEPSRSRSGELATDPAGPARAFGPGDIVGDIAINTLENTSVLCVTAQVTLVPLDRLTGRVLRRLPSMLQTAIAQLDAVS